MLFGVGLEDKVSLNSRIFVQRHGKLINLYEKEIYVIRLNCLRFTNKKNLKGGTPLCASRVATPLKGTQGKREGEVGADNF